MPETFCGFVGLIGRPNVGKSTLLNRLVGQKISITAPRPQTTRNRILGIKTLGDTQMIFIDTPGIHQSGKLLNQRIVHYAIQTLAEADLMLVLLEPLRGKLQLDPEDAHVLELIQNRKERTLLVINKMDTVTHAELLRSIEFYHQQGPFAEIIPLSALKSINLERLGEVVRKYLPAGPFYFAEDQITDVSERFLAAEFVREELFRQLQEELPYSTAVQVESFEESPECLRISGVIYVERESQKGIVIGKGGQRLKKIGTEARKKMESLLGNQVFLQLHVRVLHQWTTTVRHLDQLGLN